MRHPQFRLTNPALQDTAADFLLPHLGWQTYGRLCTPDLLLHLLFCAAAWACSLTLVCLLLSGAPCDDLVHKALKDNLTDLSDLNRRLNRSLAGSLALLRRYRRARRGECIAIDLTYIPYYGDDDAAGWVVSSKARQGTRRFLVYATAYLILAGQRYTLALQIVSKDDPLENTVKALLQLVRKLRLTIRLVLLDRGFYKVAVFRYLQAAHYPFLLPAIVRGRHARDGRPAGGTRQFASWKKSGTTRYQLCDKRNQKATVTLFVHVKNHGGRKGKHGRYVWLYAGWHVTFSRVPQVSRTYRQRFAIESSYRQMNEGRGRTSSRDMRLRLLYIGVGLVLRNVWVWLHWERLSDRSGGFKRRLRPQLMPLRSLLFRIAAACVQELGGIEDEITLPPPSPPRQRSAV